MRLRTFRTVGEALWGPHYRSEMARQLNVHLSSVNRWDAGKVGVPDYVAARLCEIMRQRGEHLDRLVSQVQGERAA